MSKTHLVQPFRDLFCSSDYNSEIGSFLSKVIRNIVDAPNDPKFRYLKLENAKVVRMVENPLVLSILTLVGFVEEGAYMVNRSEDQDLDNLKDALQILSLHEEREKKPFSLFDGYGMGEQHPYEEIPEDCLQELPIVKESFQNSILLGSRLIAINDVSILYKRYSESRNLLYHSQWPLTLQFIHRKTNESPWEKYQVVFEETDRPLGVGFDYCSENIEQQKRDNKIYMNPTTPYSLQTNTMQMNPTNPYSLQNNSTFPSPGKRNSSRRSYHTSFHDLTLEEFSATLHSCGAIDDREKNYLDSHAKRYKSLMEKCEAAERQIMAIRSIINPSLPLDTLQTPLQFDHVRGQWERERIEL